MTIDPSALQIEVHEHERCRRTLRVAVPPEVIQREQQKALERLAGRIKVPGFRKGKAPASAVERHAPALLGETLQRVIDESYGVALRERALEPISEGEVEGVEYEPESGLSFRVTFDVAPTLELVRLDGLRVELPAGRVGARDVEEVVRRLLAENAIWRPAEDAGTPREGDLVTVEIERLEGGGSPATGGSRPGPSAPLHDVGLPWLRRLRLRADTRLGKRFQIVLGEGDAVPDLENAIRTLTPGETREVEIAGDAPDDASGTPLHLRLTLVDRRMRELPDLDDAFARSLGDFDGVDALRRRIRSDLEEEAREEAERLLAVRLLDAVVEANPFEVPRGIVERHITAALGDTRGADPGAVEHARAELAEGAEAAVKRRLVVDHLAHSEGLSATPEEVDARIAEIARAGGAPPEQIRSRLVHSGRLDALRQDVTEKKVVAFLIARSEIARSG